MSLGERLRAARKASGLSQTELAAGACSLSYVSHVEAGRRSPSADLLALFETRLSLPAGSLAQAEHEPDATNTAELAEAVASARELCQRSAYSAAAELAAATIRRAEIAENPPIAWLAHAVAVDAAIGLGHYREAAETAEAMMQMLSPDSSDALAVRTALHLAKAAQLERGVRAVPAAEDALRRAQALPLGHELRIKSLHAALLVSSHDRTQRLAELVASLELNADPHLNGLSAWVLGNAAFDDGHPDDGIYWHNQAQQDLSPTTDFRNWARFLRATADQRVNAGHSSDVEQLIHDARFALTALDHADELAALEATAAKYHRLEGRPAEAFASIERGLAIEDVPAETRGELLLVAGYLHQDAGRTVPARQAALDAARAYTKAGMSEEAEAAWQLADALG